MLIYAPKITEILMGKMKNKLQKSHAKKLYVYSRFRLHFILIPIVTSLAFTMHSNTSTASERIGYEAEHTLESPMNARYLALPWIADNFSQNKLRLQTGFNKVSASRFGASTLMLGLEYTLPTSSTGGYLFSIFSDLMQFNQNPGSATFDPAFINKLPFNTPLAVEINDTRGSAQHYGISGARTNTLNHTQSWQYGLILEYYNIEKFAVSFDSSLPDNNFSAVVDYGTKYSSLTPYISFQQKLLSPENFSYTLRILAAWPLPRQGFYGRLSFDNFDRSGSTDSIGNGKHIPDPYLGFGLTVKLPGQKWKIDIGASLNFMLTEGFIHKGINRPVFLNIVWNL